MSASVGSEARLDHSHGTETGPFAFRQSDEEAPVAEHPTVEHPARDLEILDDHVLHLDPVGRSHRRPVMAAHALRDNALQAEFTRGLEHRRDLAELGGWRAPRLTLEL